MGVHKSVMVSPICGFDQWIDNHYAIDFSPQSGNMIYQDAFAENFKNLGLPYHWW